MKYLIFILFFAFTVTFAQNFEIIVPEQRTTVNLGDEAVFDILLINTGSENLTMYIVRTENNIPSDWTSSLCVAFCFSPNVDSVATTRDFGGSPIAPGDTTEVSLHFFTGENPDSGNVKLKIGDVNNPSQFEMYAFHVSTYLADVDESDNVSDFILYQNYPNPFSAKGGQTTIRYSIPASVISSPSGASGEKSQEISPFGRNDNTNVTLKIYDALGREVATLVNAKQAPGEYSVQFNAESALGGLPSGIYFYALRAGDFVQTRKMVLMK